MDLFPMWTLTAQAECSSQPWARRVSLHCSSPHTVCYPWPLSVMMDQLLCWTWLCRDVLRLSPQILLRDTAWSSVTLSLLWWTGAVRVSTCSACRACPSSWFWEWWQINGIWVSELVPGENLLYFLSSHQLWTKEECLLYKLCAVN